MLFWPIVGLVILVVVLMATGVLNADDLGSIIGDAISDIFDD